MGVIIKNGAQEKTRTSTTLRSLAPEASASTNSATWARIYWTVLETGFLSVERIAVLTLVSNLFKLVPLRNNIPFVTSKKIRSTNKKIQAIQFDGIELLVMLR